MSAPRSEGVVSAVLTPTGPPSRVIAGDPQTAELVLHVDGRMECGIWEVTPGEFHSAKPDSGEVMHFATGAGSIEHPDGSRTAIGPGVALALPPGWTGVWRVTETVRKSYTIYAVTD